MVQVTDTAKERLLEILNKNTEKRLRIFIKGIG